VLEEKDQNVDMVKAGGCGKLQLMYSKTKTISAAGLEHHKIKLRNQKLPKTKKYRQTRYWTGT